MSSRALGQVSCNPEVNLREARSGEVQPEKAPGELSPEERVAAQQAAKGRARDITQSRYRRHDSMCRDTCQSGWSAGCL